ncbi:uncharacterized protein LOC113297799 [Papaver somniferum]|uniref:uncharacterized protein LOC113297799 n=1 Tax=Papaver somniferum TaxID=3469 RepID=UPI000E6FE896|nr:uncharacterized protein LOC113297799 [Papaver somniferum]
MESLLLTVNGGVSFFNSSSRSSFSDSLSKTISKWELKNNQNLRLTNVGIRRMHGKASWLLANPNVYIVPVQVSAGKGNPGEVVMVDPLEAKRLATKQMEEIKAREKLGRQRRIEAINGTWAMLGLTAGLVIEGRTGDSIITQLEGYWRSIQNFILAQPSLVYWWRTTQTFLSNQDFKNPF